LGGVGDSCLNGFKTATYII